MREYYLQTNSYLGKGDNMSVPIGEDRARALDSSLRTYVRKTTLVESFDHKYGPGSTDVEREEDGEEG